MDHRGTPASLKTLLELTLQTFYSEEKVVSSLKCTLIGIEVIIYAVITINTPSRTLYGDSLVLVCSSVALPTEYVSRASIQWWGPNGVSLDGMSGVAVGEQISDGLTSSRTLAFDFLRSSMDGVFTCQFSIEYMNESYTETKSYSLTVSGEYVT